MKKLLGLAVLTFSAFFLFACDGNTTNTNRNTANNTTANTNQAVVINSNTPSNINTANTSNANSVAVVQDNFWISAAQGGMAEVELGKLALSKSQNAEVKKFAQMMVTDHTKVNNDLIGLAATKKVILPAETDSKHKSIIEDLNKLTGADFDKKYVDTMVSGHEDTVGLFEDQAKDDSDTELKNFAATALPKIKLHLETIRKIQESMKGK